MLECCRIVTCCILSAIMLLIADSCHSCFACHLQTVHPFPVIFISISTEIISSFQWHACFAKLLPCSSFSFRSTHMHRISYLAYHSCIASCLLVHFPWLIVVPFLVFLFWVELGDEFVNEKPVEYAYEDQVFDNSENLAGKMTIPSKSLLSLLASCSLYRSVALPTTCYIMPPIFPCQASNPPFLANRCLAMFPLLLSPSDSVASCRRRWRLLHVGLCLCWDITISLI